MAGKRRWAGLGAAFGLTPTVWTGLFILLDKLSLPAWTAVAVGVASPFVGGLLGLLCYVVIARIDRDSAVDQRLAQAAADAARLGMLELEDAKAGSAFEILVTRVPDGFRTVVRRRCR
jgi:hypothetical protein